MMLMGAAALLAFTGVFSGTPYHGRTGRILNRADRELKRREKKKYSD